MVDWKPRCPLLSTFIIAFNGFHDIVNRIIERIQEPGAVIVEEVPSAQLGLTRDSNLRLEPGDILSPILDFAPV
jgi:hypothetical protein